MLEIIIGFISGGSLIGILTFVFTAKSMIKKEKSNAKIVEHQAALAEIGNVERKIGAYNKIISDLDKKLIASISNCQALEEKYNELESKYRKLSLDYEVLKKKHDYIKSKLDNENNC